MSDSRDSKHARALALFATLALSACGGPPGADQSPEQGAAIARAQRSGELAKRVGLLMAAGWTVDFAAAAVDEFDFAAEPGGRAVHWHRVIVPASGGADLKVGLIAAWAEGSSTDSIALRPEGDAAREAVLVALAGNDQPAGSSASEPMSLPAEAADLEPLSCGGMGASCAGGGCCQSGLSCFGQDNHERCNCSSTWKSEYSIRLINLPGCREEDNLAGVATQYRVVRGCGFSLVPNRCGTGITVPSWVTSEGVDTVCRQRC
jgi:hypothetical protein